VDSASFETFGAWIEKRREDRGWSQRKLATLAGITNAALSRLEHGQHDAHEMATLQKLACALNLPLATVIQAAGYDLGLREAEARASADSPVVQLPIVRRVSPLIAPLAGEANIMGYATVERSHLTGDPNQYFLVRVADDSMIGADMVPELSLVLVHRSTKAGNDDIALVSVGSEDAVFRFVTFTGDKVVLTAAHSAVRPRVVPRRAAHIFGIAIEVITRRRITKMDE